MRSSPTSRSICLHTSTSAFAKDRSATINRVSTCATSGTTLRNKGSRTMSTEASTAFWKSQTQYPFAFTRRRRIHELNYLVPRLEKTGGKRLLDLGCGD